MPICRPIEAGSNGMPNGEVTCSKSSTIDIQVCMQQLVTGGWQVIQWSCMDGGPTPNVLSVGLTSEGMLLTCQRSGRAASTTWPTTRQPPALECGRGLTQQPSLFWSRIQTPALAYVLLPLPPEFWASPQSHVRYHRVHSRSRRPCWRRYRDDETPSTP